MARSTLSVPVFCAAWAKDGYVVCGGGGGATRSGRGNMLILARWTGSAMEQLYTRSTGLDAPYHLAIHPNGTDFVCSFIANEWHDGKLEFFRLAEDLSIESAHREIVIAKEQTAMAFSMDGTMFATAGMNGHLRVYKWPSLELLVDEQCEIGSAEFKSLEFSEEGTLLAASTSGGKTYVWELHGDNHLRVIPSEEGRYCWFSRSSTPQLHVASSKGHITNWSEDWRTKETRKERFCTHPFSAFSVSSDGKLLAMGCSEGDVLVVEAATLKVVQRVKSAHSFAITAVEFSKDNRYFLSTSLSGGLRVSERTESTFKVAVLAHILQVELFLWAR
ncbi:hypothetical protein SELMODRAFT_425986 [Selaginella moellendorffii]|uniref:Uncharacterized protein n=1 Tax=Selaginella moellendorffii TaxID=88036 RepID=D8SUY8_SELML|nr:hypothetical protein SELMODRAFT_425986 [Selaginella moellendorffii]